VLAAIKVLLAGQSADGSIPDRVNTRLVPIYFPGALKGAINAAEALTMLQDKDPRALHGPMGAGPALDNPMFMVALVYNYHRFFNDDVFVAYALPALRRSLNFVPINRGLVFNDPQRPSCTYGFQDNIAKGGHDLFCTLLYVIACRQMEELEPSEAMHWHDRAAAAEENLWLLWDEEHGAYLAADEVCRQVDVWGNAFLVAQGIGDPQYLAKHYDSFIYAGQVRHLPKPEYWERMFKPIGEETYQNGGYWGTASGWMIEALRTVDPVLAKRTLGDLLDNYQKHGILEWISPQGGKGPDLYVATIVNVWSLVKDGG
jgi:hypothetical protein